MVHYDLRLRLDIAQQRIAGELTLRLLARGASAEAVVLDVGELAVDSVAEGGAPLAYEVSERRLTAHLAAALPAGRSAGVRIVYHGQPRRGLRFFPDRQQAYSVFSTSQWMPAVDTPDQKATLRLRLTVPTGLVAVASGAARGQRAIGGGLVEHEWEQRKPLPTYVFGFAVGPFERVTEKHGGIRLEYLGAGFSRAELGRVFAETGSMLEFFTQKAGVRLPGGSYAQVLAAGRVEQEVGSFTLLSESYGRRVLDDARDLWLMAHELSHQWWGNSVTCRAFTDFWLNEGIASFMADAWLEQRFGPEPYVRQIQESRAAYERVRDASHDKPLVFPSWDKPSADDRTLVYSKGAYVMHLLRQELGEKAFWDALGDWTRGHMGASVTTADLQRSFEASTRRDLGAFFAQWVYGPRLP